MASNRLADLALLAKAIAPSVRDALRPIGERLRALEARAGVPGPSGKDGAVGAPGVNGRDGLGVADFTATYDGERLLTLAWSNGADQVSVACKLPIPIFRGAYAPGAAYERGDAVVYAGSTWIAKRDTADRPDEHAADRAWQLSAKRGKDGRAL